MGLVPQIRDGSWILWFHAGRSVLFGYDEVLTSNKHFIKSPGRLSVKQYREALWKIPLSLASQLVSQSFMHGNGKGKNEAIMIYFMEFPENTTDYIGSTL